MPRFTQGELEVMRILWEGGEQKPAEIQSRFPRAIKNSALRSYLSVLLQKGHVARRRRGKAYFYKATTREDSAFRRMCRELVDTFCGGSTEALLCRLIRSEKLTEAELRNLRRLADDEQGGGKSS